MCDCRLKTELTPFFRCSFYPGEKLELLHSPYDIDLAMKEPNEDSTINQVLFGYIYIIT